MQVNLKARKDKMHHILYVRNCISLMLQSYGILEVWWWWWWWW